VIGHHRSQCTHPLDRKSPLPIQIIHIHINSFIKKKNNKNNEFFSIYLIVLPTIQYMSFTTPSPPPPPPPLSPHRWTWDLSFVCLVIDSPSDSMHVSALTVPHVKHTHTVQSVNKSAITSPCSLSYNQIEFVSCSPFPTLWLVR